MSDGSKKMHDYMCIINKTPYAIPKSNIFYYDYKISNPIKINICIHMLKKGASFEYSTKAKYAENVMHDALKKVMLLYIIRFGESLDIQSISLIVDRKTENKMYKSLYYKSMIHKEERFIYSLVEDDFFHKIQKSWQNNHDFMNNLLLYFENKDYKPLYAALYALILSKTKKYESERFIWLWKAINGIYNFYWTQFRNTCKSTIKNTNIRGETYQIYAFARMNHFKTGFTDGNYKSTIYNDVVKVIDKLWDGKDVTQQSLQNEHQELAKQIEQKLFSRQNKAVKRTAYDLDAYTYLLLDMAYYYRCNIFHADKPVKLFSYEEEDEIKTLKVLNSVMEDYIERTLPNWFDWEHMQSIFSQSSQTIAKELVLMKRKKESGKMHKK